MSNIFDLDEQVIPQTYDNISALKPHFPWLEALNAEQRLAVETTQGPLLVLSGAGTGKTRVLTTRLAYILSKGLASPWNCFVVTFTNKAAKEMKTRVQEMIGSMADSVWLGTFHSMCVKILRKHAELAGLKSNFTILDEDDQKRLIKQILEAEKIDDKKYPPASFVEKFSLWKDKGYTLQRIAKDFKGNLTTDIYQKYQARLKELNAVDFGDIILLTLEILQNPDNAETVLKKYQDQFKYIMVDEYQDTNVTQYLLLRLLSQKHKNICCVGDDDQSIYSWRGAEIENILRFEKDFQNAVVIRLEQNYRSTANILTAASNLIAHNSERLGKTLKVAKNSPASMCDNEKIQLISVYSGAEEAAYIAEKIEDLHRHSLAYDHMAVLVRTAAQMREIEEKFISEAIAYQVIGGPKFYERMEIRDMIAYLRVVAQSADDLALGRIINKPSRKIGDKSVQKFRDFGYQNHMPLLEAMKQMCEQGLVSGQLLNASSELVKHFEQWQKDAQNLRLDELADKILDESGYLDMLKKENSVESQGRIDNLKELVNVMSDVDNYPTLEDFLEHVSLVTETDNATEANKVMLMTLHAAKGLEFDAVFLPGWEDGLFPHERALNEGGSNALEEERRLAYVALTRAKQKLYILTTMSRKVFGQWQNNQPSRFLNEIPPSCLQIISNTYQNYNRGYDGYQKHSNYNPKQKTSYDDYSYEPDEEYASSQKANYKGMRVYHPSFGKGTLMSVEDGDKCVVYFDNVGRKKIYASYLRKA